MSPHFSWINLTCLICKINEDDFNGIKKLKGNFEPLGTGFLLFSYNRPYLITARHVIQNEGHTLPNLACIFDFFTDINKSKSKEIISISENQKSNNFNWKFHEKDKLFYGKGNNYLIDIAVTRINPRENLTKALYWNNSDIRHLLKFEDTNISNDIRVVGYPLVFTSSNDYSPTIRRGIIARKIDNQTEFSNKDFPSQSFLIDCFIDNGNSGSPVVKIPKDSTYRLTTNPNWDPNVEGLIGVATGHFASENRAHAGLGICISTQYIVDIIRSIEDDEEIKLINKKITEIVKEDQ